MRNSAETQQSGHAQKSGPEVKNGRRSAKDGGPEKLRCGIIQKQVRTPAPTYLRLMVVVQYPPLYGVRWAEMARQFFETSDHPANPNRRLCKVEIFNMDLL